MRSGFFVEQIELEPLRQWDGSGAESGCQITSDPASTQD